MRHFCKTLCLISVALLYSATIAQAQRGGYRKMICRGAEDAFRIDDLEKEGGKVELAVNFSASKVAPGSDVWKLDPGTCSWADRLVAEEEPVQIVLAVTPVVAQRIRTHLNSSPANFWQFYVRDTERGHYVTRNHAQLIVTTKEQGAKKLKGKISR
jgi:hypothetical protein